MSIESVKSAVLLNQHKFTIKFYEWVIANIHIYEYFEKSAMQVWRAGHKHYGARTIVEVMRHRTAIREIGNGEWKINNNYVPDMAVLYMELHPEQDGFFQLKRKAA